MIDEILRIAGFITIIVILLSIISLLFNYALLVFIKNLSFGYRMARMAIIYKLGIKPGQGIIKFKDNDGLEYELRLVKGK